MILTPLRNGMITAFVIFTFFTTVENIQPHGWLDWYRLSQEGKQAKAQITHKRLAHQTCFFKYVVDNQIYNSSDGKCNLKVGESAMVVYLPSDPSFAKLRNPSSYLSLLVFATFFMSLTGGCLAALRIHGKVKQSR